MRPLAPPDASAPPSGLAERVTPGRELALLAFLFVCFRLTAIAFLRPGGHVFVPDADLRFYRSLGELSLSGYYPYLHYWVEYPPLFAGAIVGLYRLSLLFPAWPDDLLSFQLSVGALLAAADLANLLLVYSLAAMLHGRPAGLRAAGIYALLFFPLYAALTWFDAAPLCFLLLAVWLALRGRAGLAGAVAGLGFLVKVLPILAAPAAFLALERRPERARFAAALALAVGAVLAPLWVANRTMLLASARFIVGRGSWETIWALLEGYYGAGRTPPLASRFDPAMAGWEVHPTTLPWPAIAGAFGLLCLALYTRRLDWRRPAVALPAVALTLNLCLLFSKGYSPQFLVYPLALLIVVLPSARGAVYAVLLTALNMVEWPWAFGFFGDDHRGSWLVVVARSLLWLWLSAEYAGLLFAGPDGGWARLRPRLGAAVSVGAAGAAALGLALAGSHYFSPTRPDDAAPAALASYIAAFPAADSAALASTRAAFYQVRPLVAVGTWVLAEGDEGQWPTPLDRRVSEAGASRSRLWVILDQAGPASPDLDRAVQALDARGSRATDAWFGRFHLLGFAPDAGPGEAPSARLDAVFGNALALRGYDLPARGVTPGGGLTLALYFEARAAVGLDYKAFVHLVDSAGRPVAQRDRPLSRAGRGTSRWSVGEAVREGYDLLVPAGAPCGDYALLTGLYDPATGQRPRLTSEAGAGGDRVTLGQVRVCGG